MSPRCIHRLAIRHSVNVLPHIAQLVTPSLRYAIQPKRAGIIFIRRALAAGLGTGSWSRLFRQSGQDRAVHVSRRGQRPPHRNDQGRQSRLGTDADPAEEPKSAQVCEPKPLSSPQPARSDGTAPTRKRGPKRDYESTLRVAEVVARVAPDGDWRSKLDDVCEALHDEGIPFPKSSGGKDRNCRSWMDFPERALAIKVIEYRLDIANEGKKSPPETLS